jgi:membrane fusion protein, multidrug efflux system
MLLVAVVIFPVGCRESADQKPKTEAAPVTVAYPLERSITDYAEFTGRTAAINAVQIRARVSGYLEKINFTEGAELNEGAVLFEIDPRPYNAAFDQAKAAVAEQKAKLKFQEALYDRDRTLYKKDAVSLEQLQQDKSTREVTAATLESAQASLKTAALNVEWTKIMAPIAGRVGRTLITKGNLVVADQTLLTTLVSQDPIYAYFDVDEPTVLRVQQLIREGKLESVTEGAKIPVFLGLESEKGFPHKGTVDFVNNQFNLGTATLQARGVFANPKPAVGVRVFTPGQFVRIRVAVSPLYKALLISEGAALTDQGVRYVYVVDEQNNAKRRTVTLGTVHEGMQVITKGLAAGDRVIIDGLQKVQPEAIVQPKVVPMPEPNAGN